MQVIKYIPDRMYGFLLSDTDAQEVFFHLRVFRPLSEWPPIFKCAGCKTSCQWGESPPPPILGEWVDVELDTSSDKPRASKIWRKKIPTPLNGNVETFDAARGYGFIQGADSITYHLHRCEIVEGRIPLTGQSLMFYAGQRQGKPRACHVKVC